MKSIRHQNLMLLEAPGTTQMQTFDQLAIVLVAGNILHDAVHTQNQLYSKRLNKHLLVFTGWLCIHRTFDLDWSPSISLDLFVFLKSNSISKRIEFKY